jgi:beta-N-acetylhexosaminidase
LIASDLEHGAGAMISSCTNFPWPMAAGAADDLNLIYAMGQATAREGRAWGVHWTFSPVVDLNINFQNPVTNIRSLGDDPQKVSRQASALITGIQGRGEMAATAKHFPGDGMDDRDQHLCTSVNSSSLHGWWDTYGKVWRAAIEAGVMSIMVGHISFPAYDGLEGDPAAALPATLNPRLQVDLLRGELGFEGVIISDAAPMIGIASRAPREERAVRNILAGSDIYLFADPRQDFRLLLQAVRSGRLPMEQVDLCVRRVLEMKACLGLHRDPFGPALAAEEKAAIAQDAQAIAEKSITLLRGDDAPGNGRSTPLRLQPGARVLTVTVSHRTPGRETDPELALIDEELGQRGLQVDHLPGMSPADLMAKAGEYDAVFVNVVMYPHARIGTIRLTGEVAMPFWEAFWVDHPHVVFTAFGSPYLLYELPHLPNLWAAYGNSPASQRAAVKAWLGEIEPQGKCPVKLP